MIIDPFIVKQYGKCSPVRVGYTSYARVTEILSRGIFPILKIPRVSSGACEIKDYARSDTAVTPSQMGALIQSLKSLPESVEGAVVEIGSYRGVTTRKLCQNTSRSVYAVDPFQGYGGVDDDFSIFRENTVDLSNVEHLRMTSGAAAKNFSDPVAFVFVDAVHDYVNTIFDVCAWSANLSVGGLLAMHDVDNPRYAGTHVAAWQMSRRFQLVCHIPGLVILCKSQET